MRVDKLRTIKSKDLGKQLDEAFQELFNLRFRHATRQLSNYTELRNVKKNIARIKTIIRERELAGE